MKTITNFNKVTLDLLSQELSKSIQSVAEKLGLSLSVGDIRYTNATATVKIEASAISLNGKVVDKDAANFLTWATLYGLKESDLNKVITIKGESWEIIGARSKRCRCPIYLKRLSDNKTYCYTVETVKKAFVQNEVLPETKSSTKDLVFNFIHENAFYTSCKEAHESFTNSVKQLSYESFNDYWRLYHKEHGEFITGKRS